MNDKPRDPGDDESGDAQNPFRGTPFEQLFSAGGLGGPGGLGGLFGSGGAGAGGLGDLSGLMAQMQAMMQPYDGPLNWDAALDIARKQVAAAGTDPTPNATQSGAIDDAVRLADVWLDAVTDFPSGITSTAAWSRAEWIVGTTDVWKVLVEPMASHAVNGLTKALPEQARSIGGPFLDMMGRATGAMLATQVGSGLGALAGEVLSASDIGLPLGPTGKAALVPANIAVFADGLDVPAPDVVLYLALREAAHQRLFAHVPWLRTHLVDAVAAYAGGLDIDMNAIQDTLQNKLGNLDPSNLSELQEALEGGGLFEIEASPAQKAARERIEVTLALIEGWVDEVVGQATESRMPNAAKLAEAMRRRRASGGPAERTFGTLVGLELRPRRLRDAATLWGSLRTRQGTDGRDGVWMHPDLLPTATDLDDPLGFREDAVRTDEVDGLSEEIDFDAELRKLIDGPGDEGTKDEGTSDDSPGDSPGDSTDK